jgi:hypothetical protein
MVVEIMQTHILSRHGAAVLQAVRLDGFLRSWFAVSDPSANAIGGIVLYVTLFRRYEVTMRVDFLLNTISAIFHGDKSISDLPLP